MAEINYNNRYFKMVDTSTGDHGAVAGTVFHYRQEGSIVWGTYSGGTVAYGTMLAKVLPKGDLDLSFQHMYSDGRRMMGTCYSTLEILADGRYRLDENFTVIGTENIAGNSVVEEFFPPKST